MSDTTDPSAFVVSNNAPSGPYQPYTDVKPPSESSDKFTTETHAFVFPEHLPQPPFVNVQGVPNFRDLGGYECAAPTGSDSSKTYMVRRGLLFRCAHPTQMTQDGAKTYTQELGIKDMYDLRSEQEINRLAASFLVPNPNRVAHPFATEKGVIDVPGATRHFTPVYQQEDYGPVALARKLKWYTSPNSPGTTYSTGFVNAYRDIATHGARAYTIILRHILERPKDPLVFHCTAGKDRTGVIGAIILRLCGVPDSTIEWEYGITEAGLGEWRELFITRIAKGGLGGGGGSTSTTGDQQVVSRAEAARICGSRAANMRAFLETVLDGEFGGAEKYLADKCGFSGEEIEQLKKNLVVPVGSEKGQGEVVEPVGIKGWTLEDGVLENGAEKKSS